MEQRWEAERPDSLEVLLAREWPKDSKELSSEDQQTLAYLKRMQELARGLRDSEYWDLVSLVLIQGLEDAKGALESETTSDRDMRLHQGGAKAYREAFNLFVGLAAKSPEVKDG